MRARVLYLFYMSVKLVHTGERMCARTNTRAYATMNASFRKTASEPNDTIVRSAGHKSLSLCATDDDDEEQCCSFCMHADFLCGVCGK